VQFLLGRVATNDGTALPHDVLVERVCKDNVRQQVYAYSSGEFSMQLGSRADSYVDASADSAPQYDLAGTASVTGISRRELATCELRASASGFRSNVITLVDLDPMGGTVNVGAIVLERAKKIEGTTLSVTPYKAPKDARIAYERGLEAEQNGKLADARKHFEKAVEIYPSYASAWFQLGTVLEKENQQNAARAAYTRATTIDTKFLPPYLSLASLACEAKDWPQVLKFTGHIMDLDPWYHHSGLTGYMVDLDPWNYSAAYFYNALANFELKRIDDAEKSALMAEHRDLLTVTRYPQLHLLMAEIYAQKNNYAAAITEMQTYLQLVPGAKQADEARERLAKWEQLSASVPKSDKTD